MSLIKPSFMDFVDQTVFQKAYIIWSIIIGAISHISTHFFYKNFFFYNTA